MLLLKIPHIKVATTNKKFMFALLSLKLIFYYKYHFFLNLITLTKPKPTIL